MSSLPLHALVLGTVRAVEATDGPGLVHARGRYATILEKDA